MGQALFIVWRESIEALLVVGSTVLSTTDGGNTTESLL